MKIIVFFLLILPLTSFCQNPIKKAVYFNFKLGSTKGEFAQDIKTFKKNNNGKLYHTHIFTNGKKYFSSIVETFDDNMLVSKIKVFYFLKVEQFEEQKSFNSDERNIFWIDIQDQNAYEKIAEDILRNLIKIYGSPDKPYIMDTKNNFENMVVYDWPDVNGLELNFFKRTANFFDSHNSKIRSTFNFNVKYKYTTD